MPFEKQAVVFYVVLNNYFEKVELNKIKETEKNLLDYISKFHNDILENIRKTNELTPENEAKLKEALGHFFENLN
jgi:F0F1-type ATP synthase alpha subunit